MILPTCQTKDNAHIQLCMDGSRKSDKLRKHACIQVCISLIPAQINYCALESKVKADAITYQFEVIFCIDLWIYEAQGAAQFKKIMTFSKMLV